MKSRFNKNKRRRERKARDAESRRRRRINSAIPDEGEPLPVARSAYRVRPNETRGSTRRKETP